MNAAAPGSGFQGSDVATLDRVAARAEAAADQLSGRAVRIRTTVIQLRANAWFTGGASAAYAQHLEAVVLPWLASTQQALTSAAGALRRNAGEQRGASTAYATPPLPSGDCLAPPCAAPSSGAPVAGGVVAGLGHGVSLAGLVVEQVDEQLITDVRAYRRTDGTTVREHVRWRQGYAATMSTVGSAAVWRAVLDHPTSVVGRRVAPWLFAGAGQTVDDWDDPGLTRGDRVARTGAAVALQGGGGLLGGLAGVAGGAAVGATIGSVVPVIGTGIGGVIGGVVGGFGLGAGGSWVGAQVQEHVLDGVIDEVGDGLDRWFDDPPSIDGGGGGR